MPTTLDRLQDLRARAVRRHGPNAAILKDLDAQIISAQQGSGGAAETFLVHGHSRTPNTPKEPT